MARVLEAIASTITLDRDGIAQSQSPGAAGNLTLNGAGTDWTASTGALATPRPVAIYGAADETGKTFTVTGTDRAGTTITETITGPGLGLTVSTNKLFKTVASVAISAASAGAVEVGWTAVSYSRWIFASNSHSDHTLMLRYIVRGTANYDVQATSMAMNRDSHYAGGDYPDDITTLQSGKTASQDDPLVVPHQAYRLKVNSQNADVVLRLSKSVTGA